jgi:regulator of sigma E protease
MIGVTFAPIDWPPEALRTERGGIVLALQHSWEMAVFNVKVLAKLVQGEMSLYSLSGPLGVFAGAWLAMQQGFSHYLSFLAFVSIGLGIFNLLPIPGLDGARLIYLIWPPSPAAELLVFRWGMIVLILLMIHVFIGDILRLLLH